jgi:DNA replication and repair protein RecF
VGEPPALLLDDVLSDLDDVRRRLLFEITARSGSQTFLSCTNLRAFPAAVLEQAMVYDVTSGEVTRNEFRV